MSTIRIMGRRSSLLALAPRRAGGIARPRAFCGALAWALGLVLASAFVASPAAAADDVASRPPMGWNSYNAYGASVTEAEFRANVELLAAKLKPVGYRYAVVDFCWSHPSPGSQANPDQHHGFLPALAMDGNGRLLPALERFPSAAGGKGFAPLAEWVHGLGLEFGIHVMRGIPRQAVARRTPVLGTRATADQVADAKSTCSWLNHMFGVDLRRNGAQAYYDSIFRLYAEWGVDYVKVDDIASPYHAAEIEAVRRAIDRSGRPMVLSLSPGATPLDRASHVARHANLWRVSADFWDEWPQLRKHFALLASWAPLARPGAWPDADMIPLGRLSLRGPWPEERRSRFTAEEGRTLMSLLAIARSPLMYGGDLPSADDATLALLTNPEVLEVNQSSTGNRELRRDGERVSWTASAADGDRYLALFNLGGAPARLEADLPALGLRGSHAVRDLWDRKPLAPASGVLAAQVPPHGSLLLRIGK